MTKISWKPGTMIYPVPPAMISCGTMEKPNVMTAAWTGIISSEPPMTYVSIRPSRYSNEIIRENMEFVINLPTLAMVTAADYCGVKSGRDTDKFKDMELTAEPCTQVAAPQIKESPVSVECKVKEIRNFGTHDMFLAEIVAVNVEDKYLDEAGKFWIEKTGLLAFAHGHYFTLGRNLGSFGFSVNKNHLAMMKKMANVEVLVKEPKVVLEKAAEDEARPRGRGSKFTNSSGRRGSSSTGSRDKFDGKAKFYKSRDEDSRDGDRPARPYQRREDSRDGGDRPARPYQRREDSRDGGDRPARPYQRREDSRDGDRPARPYQRREDSRDGDRPARPYQRREDSRDGGDRPARPYQRREDSRDGDRPARPYQRREDSRGDGDRPARPYQRREDSRGDGDRPARPYQKREDSRGGSDRPARPYQKREDSRGGDRPSRPYKKRD